MTHSHTHSHTETGPPRRALAATLSVVVALIAVGVVVGMIALWPDGDKVSKAANPYSAKGVTTVSASVISATPFDCGSGSEGPDGLPSVKGNCAHVTASTAGGSAKFDLDAAHFKAGIHKGDDVKLIRFQPEGQEASYEFLDFRRGLPLTALAAMFVVAVVAVARWRGLFAVVGVGITLVALTKFMLPAFLSGESPILVTVVGSAAIMLVVLYLAHGVSIRTTSALFGTLVGLGVTAGLGVAATGWTSLTGVGSEDDQTLIAVAPHIHMSGVVAASMVVAGLGVLNDVTVTQASAVWELRAIQPAVRAGELFTSAMRIGRDHIASSVYTLVFAYAGSAMTILLLITAYQRSLGEIATTEQISEEIVRTLVGAIGLVLAVPITTAFAVMMAPRVEHPEELPPVLTTPSPHEPGSHRAVPANQ
ncbi:MAG: YibE/F family protein [Aeromicrobium sp.]